MTEDLRESSGRIRQIFRNGQASSFVWSTSLLDFSAKECIISPLFNGTLNTWHIRLYRNGRDGCQPYIGLELLRRNLSKSPVKFTIGISVSGRKGIIVVLRKEFDVQSFTFSTNTVFMWPELSWGDSGYMKVHCLIWREELPSKRGKEFLIEQSNSPESEEEVENLDAKEEEFVSRETQTEQSNTPEREENVENLDTKAYSNLHQHLKDLLLTGDDHDVVISVRNREFRAHKNILRVRSPVFAAMFKYEMKENEDNSISIDDCDPEAFDEFLKYVYTAKVENMSPGKATGLYYAGDKYDFSELKELCVQFLESSLSITSICDVIDLARKHGEHVLLESAIKFFSENVEQILETVEWQRFAANNFVVANELIIRAIKTFQDKKSLNE